MRTGIPSRRLLVPGLLLAALAATQGPSVAAWGRTALKRVTTDELGGRERYLTFVSTDKPIYRAGEKVYARGTILNAADRRPLKAAPPGYFEVSGPKGDVVAVGYAETTDSVAGFGWEVPAGQPGGQYRVRVSYPAFGIAPGERVFEVRAYRAPRLNTQIVFFRDGYGPGDKVGATLDVKRAEGGVPADAKVTITARVDGAEIHRSTAAVSPAGLCEARFELPAAIERGEGTLAFTIEDGGVVETAAKTIPILLQTVDLAIFPEGGDLVARLPNRVYVQARTPARKPADIAGVVLDAADRQVGAFRTEHEGRGRFTFRPAKGGVYRLKITEPAGIATEYPLPPVRDRGVLVQSLADAYPAREPVALRVISTEAGPFVLTLSRREEELAALTVKGSREAGAESMADATLTPPAAADGILIATVWNAEGNAVAERLLFRAPAAGVRVSVTPDRERYVPGGPVSLKVKTTDARGEPVEAVVGLTVTDASVLELIEKREQAPRLPAMVLLENEVKELADAHVYLDPANPDAPRAVDLLLGTQGWRRFALVDAAAFMREHGDAARRVLALRTVTREEMERAARVDGPGGLLGRAVDRMFKGAAVRAAPADVLEGLAGAEIEDAPVRGVVPAAPPAVVEPPPAPRPDAAADDTMRPAGKIVAALEEAQEKRERERRILRGEAAASGAARMLTVRVYAHQARADRKPGDRVDFAETLYWCAGVRTDAKTGEAAVSFELSDAVTTFRVLSDAFDAGGALGADVASVESVQPFYVEAKLPLEVSMGDRVLLPLSAVNGTADPLRNAVLSVAAARGITAGALEPFELAADGRVRRLVELSVGDIRGETDFAVEARAGGYADRVARRLSVAPRGFPVSIARGGMLEPGSPVELTLDIPASRVPGSVTSDISVYPTPLANLTKALERLIREPCGCFEQTSSTTYPLVMAQQYFLSHQGVDPKLVERSRALLEKGYQRLTGFECKERGYEWFGADPGHEALTAYGLLEFMDMSQVHNVDAAMLERTRAWLLKTRDGKGGFSRERRALHTWNTDPDCSNGYILWSLLECGEKPASLAAELAAFKAAAQASANSYALGLGANVAHLAGDTEQAKRLMDRLAAKQAADGRVEGGTTTIVASGGTSLDIETTALATLAWLREPSFAGAVEKAMQWLTGVCEDGRYGSTQSTVLALRAIVAYDKARAKPGAPGSLQLTIDGRRAGSAVAFGADTQGALVLTDIAEMLEPGTHIVRLEMTGGSPMPYSLAVNYAAETPASSADCKLALAVSLTATEVAEGDVVEAAVRVTNVADRAVPTPIAIVGIPGGLEVRHDQLKELVKAGTVASYEVIGRDVVLYWRLLDAGKQVTVPLSLVAQIPGTYSGPASRAYLYYTDEHKTWVEPLRVRIEPK